MLPSQKDDNQSSSSLKEFSNSASNFGNADSVHAFIQKLSDASIYAAVLAESGMELINLML